MIAKGKQLTDYIPQRAPLVMIDSLEEATENRMISNLLIKPDNYFVENDQFREPGIIENIAQTAAAGLGFMQKSQDIPVALGFIAAIRDLKINVLPNVGQSLRTKVEVVNKVFDITIIKGSVHAGNELIAECEMRIFIQ